MGGHITLHVLQIHHVHVPSTSFRRFGLTAGCTSPENRNSINFNHKLIIDQLSCQIDFGGLLTPVLVVEGGFRLDFVRALKGCPEIILKRSGLFVI